MNKQLKKNGGRGIEWTDYTWNVAAGCKHGCRWRMPDGTIAVCYAEDVAEGVAQAAYPEGFAHHYYHPDRLQDPLKLKEPARIFLDSMADLMGHWVPRAHVQAILDTCQQAHWHSFQLLTKNAPNLLKFELPLNVWAGVSSPPTFMFGKELTLEQQQAMLRKQLSVLRELKAKGHPVVWMSIEPLSFDVAPLIEESGVKLDWAVIGAASDGAKYFQPDARFVERCLKLFDRQATRVFFKGNLVWTPWREEFPGGTSVPATARLGGLAFTDEIRKQKLKQLASGYVTQNDRRAVESLKARQAHGCELTAEQIDFIARVEKALPTKLARA